MSLVSAAGFPECSNYSIGFKALLDYIFVEEEVFEVVRIAPTPSMNRMGQDTAIPSSTFPSDHVPLSVDLRWKS
jgi:2',5'-phosphodiesterase